MGEGTQERTWNTEENHQTREFTAYWTTKKKTFVTLYLKKSPQKGSFK